MHEWTSIGKLDYRGFIEDGDVQKLLSNTWRNEGKGVRITRHHLATGVLTGDDVFH